MEDSMLWKMIYDEGYAVGFADGFIESFFNSHSGDKTVLTHICIICMVYAYLEEDGPCIEILMQEASQKLKITTTEIDKYASPIIKDFKSMQRCASKKQL